MTEMLVTPLTSNLEKYTFAQSQQIIMQTGLIGYLRADFGSTGKEFYSTWNDACSFFKEKGFSKEFDEVINALRFDEKYGRMLNDRDKLKNYCHTDNAKCFGGQNNQYFGVRVDTDDHTYLFRLNPNKGEYNLYCYCYVKKHLEEHLVKASRGIRFINSHYREQFRIPDGEKIRIIYPAYKEDNICRYVDDYHTEVGRNIYHICEFAELIEKNGNTVIPLRDSLPEQCYAVNPANDRLIIITKGENGYIDANDKSNTPERNRELADSHNAEMGVTKGQAKAMLAGAMFGWQVSAADPKNYDNNGDLIQNRQHERGEAR